LALTIAEILEKRLPVDDVSDVAFALPRFLGFGQALPLNKELGLSIEAAALHKLLDHVDIGRTSVRGVCSKVNWGDLEQRTTEKLLRAIGAWRRTST
jgi:hypothetical protein